VIFFFDIGFRFACKIINFQVAGLSRVQFNNVFFQIEKIFREKLDSESPATD